MAAWYLSSFRCHRGFVRINKVFGAVRQQLSSVASGASPKLYVKGNGTFGCLGTGEYSDRENFSEVQLPGNAVPKIVSAGYGHSGVVTTCGRLFLMGIPVEFKRVIRISSIGDSSRRFAALVARGFTFMGGDCLPKPTLLCEDVDTVSCSGCLTAVQKIDGSVLCYGYNSYGQCGVDPEHEDAKIGKETVDYLNPITALPPSHMIDTGLQHVISLSQSGKVYTWGKGGNGQLGNSEVLFSFTPVHVDIVNKCRKVAAGFAHSAAICEEGKFYIWGKGVSDLKFGEKEQAKFSVLRYQDKLVPRVLSLPGKRKAIDIATSFYSTIVVADDLSVWAMGLGEFDRKPLCNLTQVENEVGTKGFLRLHPGYRLAKGGKRVIIFDSAPGAEPIDIILHEEDAYTKKTSIHFEDGAQIFSSNVLSMCGSLHHSLAVAIK